jgi:hypothetical protein
MNLETKITIYKFTPQVFTLTRFSAKIESHFTLNYATLVNQDVNRKSIYVSCFSWNPL